MVHHYPQYTHGGMHIIYREGEYNFNMYMQTQITHILLCREGGRTGVKADTIYVHTHCLGSNLKMVCQSPTQIFV